MDAAVVAKREENSVASRAADAAVELPCPDGLAYMGFQRAGVAFALRSLAECGGCLVADEMGLGKTIQAVGLVNARPDIKRILVVTKATLKLNWQRELNKWLTRKLTVGVAWGKEWPATDVVVANYDILSKHLARLNECWDLVVLDESHSIKNSRSIRAKAVLGSEEANGVNARFRLALTGTPIENRPAEIWTTLHFVDPKRWDNFFRFGKRYAAGYHNGFGWDFTGASNLEELQKVLRESVMVRRRKADVLTDLPPKTREVVELGADDGAVEAEQAVMRVHGAALEAAQAQVDLAAASDSEEDYKAAVERLRSAHSVEFTEMAHVRHLTALVKAPQVAENIRDFLEDSAGKLIVFAHHHDVLDAFYGEFRDCSVLVTGETPVVDRDAAVQRFQSDPACRLFFGSIRACGDGITLTAATTVGFAELDFNPSKLSQAEDRAHRIGQRDNVLVKHWILPGSLDARFLDIILAKQEVIDKALDRAGAPVYAPDPVFFPRSKEETVARKQLAEEAETITDEQRLTVHRALRTLAGKCDGAQRLDGCGFNKADTYIGHQLADASFLSKRQAALGRKVIRKYHGQLGEAILAACGVVLEAKKANKRKDSSHDDD